MAVADVITSLQGDVRIRVLDTPGGTNSDKVVFEVGVKYGGVWYTRQHMIHWRYEVTQCKLSFLDNVGHLAEELASEIRTVLNA